MIQMIKMCGDAAVASVALAKDIKADGGLEQVSFHSRTGGDIPGLPVGFAVRIDGIYQLGPANDAGDGESSEELWLCSPLQVVALFRDKSGTGWGRIIEVTDRDGRKHEVRILDRALESSTVNARALLADQGLRIREGLKARQAVIDLILRWTPPTKLQSTECLGWSDEDCAAFVLGDGRVLGNGNIVALRTGQSSVMNEIRSSGTLEDWRSKVAGPCVGNPLLILGASVALAGPLLELLGLEGGGLHFHGASSRGKTTVQRVAVSVWGSPRFLHSWRATANGIEGVAATCNSMLLALDEIVEVNGKDLEQAAYMLANGVGKVRADPLGQFRPAARWRVTILSSGEVDIATKIAEGGGKFMAGHSVRILDIAADARRHGAFDELHGCRDGAAFSEMLKRETALNFGTAGPAFVEALLRHRATVAGIATRMIDAFIENARRRFDLPRDGTVTRAVGRFAVCAIAGELATGFDLTGWSRGTAIEAANAAMVDWLDARADCGPFGTEAAVERTRAYLRANAASLFDLDSLKSPAVATDQSAGWRDRDRFYLSSETWHAIHGAFDARAAAKDLVECDLLIPGDGNNFARHAPRSISRRPRVYVVRTRILDAAEEGVQYQTA